MKTGRIITGLLPTFCLLSRSTTVPTDPSSGPAQPSPISNTNPQPNGEEPGTELKGTVLDENDEPIEDRNIEIKGDTRELVVVTDTSGTFSVGIRHGLQQIIVNCDEHQIYQKEEFLVQVPETNELKQTFTVRRK